MTDVSGDTNWPAQNAGELMRERPRQRLGDVLEVAQSPWSGAVKAAGRHSARVRFLRWSIAIFCILAAAAVATIGLFDPFRRLPGNITIGQVHVDGTRITVETPKISGFQRDGRPYEITARTGLQDTTNPNLVELTGVDARIGMRDASTLKLTAEHGSYDNQHDSLLLDGWAQIRNEVGYAIFMKTAEMDFKTGGLLSREPVKVVLKGGHVAADTMNIGNDGIISFEGDVKSTIDSGSDAKELPLTPPVTE
ncbi:LPS export ABC transporter periplasmic protein LptC [Methylocella silvestris]|uniref:Lipopolysaccharide-assembly, LptC-related protein n=1 Tax=Methylocella silvestris TaxID=199596 RepID=A0A2J7TKH6_METSI|nr:LPS export ABC transporter periplasmic protein LptC [Methylocella silvestris]PNG27264.1 lipopolysaccharide-assembly, LptC-related protein [Methylocella silvestris]